MALQLRVFADSLCKEPTANLDELRWRAARFMHLEELRKFRNQAWAEVGDDKGKEKEKERLNRPTIDRGDRHRDNRGPRFTRYTPLSVDRGKNLDEALSADLIPPPRMVVSIVNGD